MGSSYHHQQQQQQQQRERLVRLLVTVVAVMAVREAEGQGQGQQWCIARSGATDQALQAALDYACGRGMADCQPIQASGLCYLPNTLQAHASYAFNSFFQRSRSAPGACDFAATATVTITDPSYGSCTFPSSASTAGGNTTPTGGATTPTTPITNTPTATTPLTSAPPPPGFGITTGGGVGGVTPTGAGTGINPNGFGPTVPNTDFSGAAANLLPLLLFTCCYLFPLLA